MSLQSVPPDLLATIFSLLDPSSKHAWYATSKTMHAPAVLSQIRTGRISNYLLVQWNLVPSGNRPMKNILASYPPGAHLSKLTIEGSGHTANAHGGVNDDAPLLASLLETFTNDEEATRVKNVLHDVEELALLDFLVPAEATAAHLSACLGKLCPNLKVFAMLGIHPWQGAVLQSSFLRQLSAGVQSLQKLCIMDRRVTDIQALAMFPSLSVLSFSIPHNRLAFPLAPLASLSLLQHLSICESQYMTLEGLEHVLSGVPHLKSLSIPDVPSSHQLAVLSPTLAKIRFNHVARVLALAELFALAKTGHFPALECVDINMFDFAACASDAPAEHALLSIMAHNSSVPAPRIAIKMFSGIRSTSTFSRCASKFPPPLSAGISKLEFEEAQLGLGFIKQLSIMFPQLTDLSLFDCHYEDHALNDILHHLVCTCRGLRNLNATFPDHDLDVGAMLHSVCSNAFQHLTLDQPFQLDASVYTDASSLDDLHEELLCVRNEALQHFSSGHRKVILDFQCIPL